jgi:hypothetical protein
VTNCFYFSAFSLDESQVASMKALPKPLYEYLEAPGFKPKNLKKTSMFYISKSQQHNTSGKDP